MYNKNTTGLTVALANEHKFYDLARTQAPLSPEAAIRLAFEFKELIDSHLANNPLDAKDIAECVIDAYNYCIDGGEGLEAVNKLKKGV